VGFYEISEFLIFTIAYTLRSNRETRRKTEGLLEELPGREVPFNQGSRIESVSGYSRLVEEEVQPQENPAAQLLAKKSVSSEPEFQNQSS